MPSFLQSLYLDLVRIGKRCWPYPSEVPIEESKPQVGHLECHQHGTESLSCLYQGQQVPQTLQHYSSLRSSHEACEAATHQYLSAYRSDCSSPPMWSLLGLVNSPEYTPLFHEYQPPQYSSIGLPASDQCYLGLQTWPLWQTD